MASERSGTALSLPVNWRDCVVKIKQSVQGGWIHIHPRTRAT